MQEPSASEEGHRRKRHKEFHLLVDNTTQDEPPLEEEIPQLDDIWVNGSLFELDAPEAPGLPRDALEGHGTTQQGQKRRQQQDDGEETSANQQDSRFNVEWEGFLVDYFPEFYPSVPSADKRVVDLSIPNPFAEDSLNRHPTVRQSTVKLPDDGAVSGYIKFRLRVSDGDGDGVMAPRRNIFAQKSMENSMGVHHRQMPELPGTNNVPSLPPDFGRGCKLDNTDNKLLKFYLVAFCGGRTLIPKDNFWEVEIAPMIAGSECVKHALLSLASAYVLDFIHSEQLRERANYHYKRAVDLLGHALRDPEAHEVGKEDGIVSAIILLLSDDVVNWELRRAKGVEPRWYDGARTAKLILDHSDPGYRYWKPENVQSSGARVSNANRVAYVNILAQPVTALKAEDTDKLYPWLLEGTVREVRKIHGGTGVSPKLLHTYAQITHFAARMVETPDSVIIPRGAAKLEERLRRFRQWSELSEGYASPEELLASCVLDDEGKVHCPAKITDLTGETWVAAAQIYLLCRFYRRPRSHPAVLNRLNILLRCVERMPYTGLLFTSQAPFFPIFFMGLVSYREEDRRVTRDWFEAVASVSGARSSVPPVWNALQSIWKWMDEELVEDPADAGDDRPIGERQAWWEKMVERLVEMEGVLSLC